MHVVGRASAPRAPRSLAAVPEDDARAALRTVGTNERFEFRIPAVPGGAAFADDDQGRGTVRRERRAPCDPNPNARPAGTTATCAAVTAVSARTTTATVTALFECDSASAAGAPMPARAAVATAPAVSTA